HLIVFSPSPPWESRAARMRLPARAAGWFSGNSPITYSAHALTSGSRERREVSSRITFAACCSAGVQRGSRWSFASILPSPNNSLPTMSSCAAGRFSLIAHTLRPVGIARVELVQRGSEQRARILRVKRGLCAFFPRPSERISAPLQRVEDGGERVDGFDDEVDVLVTGLVLVVLHEPQKAGTVRIRRLGRRNVQRVALAAVQPRQRVRLRQ